MDKLTSRYLEKTIKDLCFARSKMCFISGPRQCGKTTMAKHLLRERGNGNFGKILVISAAQFFSCLV